MAVCYNSYFRQLKEYCITFHNIILKNLYILPVT